MIMVSIFVTLCFCAKNSRHQNRPGLVDAKLTLVVLEALRETTKKKTVDPSMNHGR